MENMENTANEDQLLKMDMENLPIDIHYNKLLDWLISRRHCEQQWQVSVFTIRQKINAAMHDMPEVDEIKRLLQGTHINYFHCRRIVELLKETEASSKNIFGQYSSKRMQDWLEVIKLYEKENVYLAEAAQQLTRNVNYEVPALKKAIAKCQQLQKDCARKESDYVSRASELQSKYTATCQQLGIEGKRVKAELLTLAQDLPSVYQKLAEQMLTVSNAIQYYKDFVAYSLKRKEADAVPIVHYICHHGNTTTYEWRTGRLPDSIEHVLINMDDVDEDEVISQEETDDIIDWGGDEPVQLDYSGDINFDITDEAVEVDYSGDINFDITDIVVEAEGTANEIDVAATEAPSVEKTISSTTGPRDSGVARGVDALSMLDNPQSRNSFIDELMELECFLTQRQTELQSSSNVLSSSQFISAPISIQADEKDVVAMLFATVGILAQITNVRMQHLMLIRSSPRYVDRMKSNLKQLLTQADKMRFNEKQASIQRQDALNEERSTEPHLSVIIKRTKELQKQIEGEISKRYKDRKINIMGEINIL